ncbi:MgtC/SapB family protein [Phenylobacterium sp. J367]|uniref:MgtC/SapB family protein n=1 Tax=Phenylobacterium sp. J367 TaxID=2898435 RepID=UPI002151A51D|nr:MgtC/SapB family protein [Phenylobacterium sp. J367]MCR5878552.1 MgtC/SapB family protein [Phenylobacterium sp. J367]
MVGAAGPFIEYVLPVAGSVLAGAAIGFEREYRGRPAGLRTHILVSLASALLMLAAVHQVRWLTDTPHDVIRIDPVRMAHGILTGIGFLCGGVIFRNGLSVHGLTTAASLWITSALGTLYGVGFYGLAIGGTFATLLVLTLLRVVDSRMPKIAVLDVAVAYRREGDPPEPAFRELLASLDMTAPTLGHRLHAEGQAIELTAALHSRSAAAEELVKRLCADPRVVAFEINPRND